MPQGVVLEVQHDLREQQRGVPNHPFKHVDVAQRELAGGRHAVVQVLLGKEGLQVFDAFVCAVEVKRQQVRPVLHHHGRFRTDAQVAQARGVRLCEHGHGVQVGRHLLGQVVELDLQHFVPGREEVGVARPLARHVLVALQGGGPVAVGLGGVPQFHHACASLVQAEVQGFGMDERRGEVLNLVEMPNQQLRVDGVVRVGLDGAEQGGAHQFPVVLNQREPEVPVEAVLDRSQVVGFGGEQGHVRADHPFEIAPHALQVGEFVVEAHGAQLLGPLVRGERHVELVQFDEGVGQGHRRGPPFGEQLQGLFKGLHGVVTHAKVQVQRAQVHQGRGLGILVPALQPPFDEFFGGVEIVQGQQGAVVHLVHGVRLVLLPKWLEVEPGLRVAAFVEIVLGQFKVRLRLTWRRGHERHQPHQKPKSKRTTQRCDHGGHSAAICWAHSARLAWRRLSIGARVTASRSMPASIKRRVSSTKASHLATALSSFWA